MHVTNSACAPVEWDASCVSSEQMDGIAEMSMQVMKDLDDRDTT